MLIGNIPGIFAESDTDCMYNVHVYIYSIDDRDSIHDIRDIHDIHDIYIMV